MCKHIMQAGMDWIDQDSPDRFTGPWQLMTCTCAHTLTVFLEPLLLACLNHVFACWKILHVFCRLMI